MIWQPCPDWPAAVDDFWRYDWDRQHAQWDGHQEDEAKWEIFPERFLLEEDEDLDSINNDCWSMNVGWSSSEGFFSIVVGRVLQRWRNLLQTSFFKEYLARECQNIRTFLRTLARVKFVDNIQKLRTSQASDIARPPPSLFKIVLIRLQS